MNKPILHLLAAFPALLACWVLVPVGAASAGTPFPRPAGLEPDIRFWTRVYSEIPTSAGFLHDSRDLGVVYETLQFTAGQGSRQRERQVESARKKIKKILQSLARGKRSGLTQRERRVLALFPDGVSNATLRAASGRVRFQLGQADKFRAGLIRAGRWEPHIRQTFRDMGLPEQLAALPHVESSYTPTAYSRVGAAGLWQFTRSTGRRFMRVDHVVDERLDPHESTVAAASLLKQNLGVTGAWPLAITAYNHGASGMRRAARKMGTTDIETIVRKYKSRTFGFASRNFYVEFLAAADVDYQSERYFGPLLVDTPIAYETVELPWYVHADPLRRALGIDRGALEGANPSLRASVWNGAKRVPRGFELKVPRGLLPKPLRTALADVPQPQRHASQTRDEFHVVRRGDTLSGIARRYHVSTRELVALNGLRSRNRIRIGQKIRLPGDGSRSQGRHVASIAPPSSGIHIVERGDTLARIGARYGVSERELLALNTLSNRNRIYVGQRIVVAPETTTTASAPKPTAPPPPPAPAEPVQPIVTDLADATPPPAASEPVAAIDVGVQPPGDEEETAGLLADPSDYSVTSTGGIEVQAAETLGHYAEWLDVRASRLRQVNDLRYGTPLQIGDGLKLDFSKVAPKEFERKRVEYHRALQGEFFAEYEIVGTKSHVTRRGDSVWYLAERKYQVPLWLLRQYNPDLDFGSLTAGTRIVIPNLKQRAS